MFTKSFDKYACEGDTISCEVDGFTITARIVRDDCTDSPDERQDGFWPSANPKDAGYVGADNIGKIADSIKAAQRVMDAWRNDDWFYCGVVLAVSKKGITLDNHAASLWGIECNYPDSDNSYLSEVANDLLPHALAVGKNIIKTLSEE